MIIYLIFTILVIGLVSCSIFVSDDDVQMGFCVTAVIIGIVWIVMSIILLVTIGTIPQTVDELNTQKLEIEIDLEEGTTNAIRDAKGFNMKLNSTHDFHENPFIGWFHPDLTKYVSPIIIPSN